MFLIQARIFMSGGVFVSFVRRSKVALPSARKVISGFVLQARKGGFIKGCFSVVNMVINYKRAAAVT